MSIPTVLIVIGLIFALVDEFQAQGRSLVAWGVVFIAVALLWGTFR